MGLCLHEHEEVTPYGEKPNGLPLGTVCNSIHPCYKFPNDDENASDYHLSFKCEETSSTSTTTTEAATTTTTTTTTTEVDPSRWRTERGSRALNEGSWVSLTQEKYSGDGEIFTDGALTDPACSALPLVLDTDHYHQDGLLLQCTDSQVDTSGLDPVIRAPNTCFLFCNFYSVMKIDTKWRDDYEPEETNTGEKLWMYVISGSAEEHVFPKLNGTQSAKEEIKCWGF